MRFFTAFLFLFSTQFVYAQQERDSLWRSWNNASLPDTVRLESLDELIWSTFMYVKPDSAEFYALIEYDFAAKHSCMKYMGYAMNAAATACDDRGNFSKALDYHARGIKIRQDMNDEQGIGVSLNNIGRCYYNIGQYGKATEYYFKALKIREKIGDKNGQATSLGNIGAVYLKQHNLERSMEYQKKSLAIREALGNKQGIALALQGIGMLYKMMGDTQTAIAYQAQSLAIYLEAGDMRGYGFMLNSLGDTYEDIGLLDKADSCQQLSLKLREQMKDSLGLSRSYYSLATIAHHRKNNTQAIVYSEYAFNIAKTVGSINLQYEIGEFLYERYKDAGRYNDALSMLEKVRATGDSLDKQNLDETVMEEQLRYDYDKKELAEKAKADQILFLLTTQSQAERNRRNIWIIILSGALLLLLAFVFFFFRTSRQKNVIAEQKNNLLKQKLLISQINPHFIFNSLNAIQNFIFSQDSLQAGNYLARFAALMRMILDFSREDFISITSEQQFLEEYLGLQQLRFREKFDYRIDIDPSIDTDDFFIPPMLAQPFVENAIEHGLLNREGKGFIGIRIYMENAVPWYEIEDNGIGLKISGERKAEQRKAHRSLATTITLERLATFDLTNAGALQIIDKSETGTGETGVKVRFQVPSREYN